MIKRERVGISVPAIILANFICFSSSAESISDVKESAKSVASGALGKVQESVKKDLSNTAIGKAINFQGTNLPETQYRHGNMYDAAKQKAADENNKETQIAEKAFLRQKEYPITHKDSFLDKAKFARDNPEAYVDWLSGKYTDCKQEGGEKILAKDIKVCDEYKQLTEKRCSVGRAIQVEAKHKYECIKERKITRKNCASSLFLKCKEIGEEDGIFTSLANPNVVDDGKRTVKGIWLVLKPLGAYLNVTNVWNGALNTGKWGCSEIKPSFTFNIRNIEEIASLKISNVDIGGHLALLVNGKIAYSTPGPLPQYGEGTRAYGNKPNIDIKSFLKTGTNTLTLVMSVCGYSSFRFQFHITKQNCIKWEERWEEKCE